ncbi:MFS transporter [Staphylococcus felis]|uniref:multidrug efflux MFS transporter SdrM n=1 Tax=Staphylococcus felis TaxID=46127 RepID=UPI000E23358A|nr:multidrug efflux MFS transporter SdrM [Staphylococcus felis]REH74374.1 MFS transporter [Staphylococcus felis]REH74503.1 MFS transporter [Staphylococcus felis]REH87044.1 MFS transporter [Staphylococcus felis]REH89507.1 MFS transporter [Staphylococcus felis]REH94718.1 MFS transporter [Staphylococcus felis]
MGFKQLSVIVSLVLIMFMSAIETSIVSLALPTMRDDLNAKLPISLVFTVYFVGIVLAIPILSELMSRVKIIYVTMLGLILFIGASLLSGLSTSFEMLVFARLIQGIGAGVNMSLAQIVPKLAFEIPFRYKVMGIVGSVWGISSILGPFLGGFILEVSTWHWLFFINIPIGLIAMAFVLYAYQFDSETISRPAIDYVGMALFYILIALLMFAVLYTHYLWMNIVALGLFFIGLVYLIRYSKRQRVTFLPIKEFKSLIRLAFLTDFLVAVVLIAFNVFIPTYLQDVLGLTPLQSGLIIFPLSIGWLFINFNLNKIESKLSIKLLYIVAFGILVFGGLNLIFNAFHPIIIAITLFFAGMSFGTAYTKDSVLVQEHVSPESMKKMMSLFTLTRNLGNSIGSAVIGYVYALQMRITQVPIQNIMLFCIGVVIVLFIIWMRQSQKGLE